MERQLSDILRQNQGVPSKTSDFDATSWRKTSYHVIDSFRELNGVCMGATWRVWSKRACNILPYQKFYRLWNKILTSRENLCALAWDACRLRQYMLTHTTLLNSKMDPIKYIFDKPALSRRITIWKMVLTEYDIQYTTQKEIKGTV